MLFGKSYLPNLAALKHVAEIILRDDYILYDKLSKVNSKEIESSVSSEGTELSTDLEILVEYLRTLGLTQDQINTFKEDLSKYLLTFDEMYLPYEYLVVPKAQSAVRNKISSELKRISKDIIVTDQDWTEIYLDFSRFVQKFTRWNSYDPETNGIIGILYRAAEFYSKSVPYEIIRNLTSMGINQEVEGEDYDSSDYQSEELFLKNDYDRFDILASNIYNVTDFLYRHSNQIYYDLFSRYKFKKVLQYKEDLSKELQRVFKYSGIYKKVSAHDPNFVLKGGRSPEAIKYANVKKTDRDLLLSELDAFIEGRADLSDLSQTVSDMLSINEDIAIRSKGKDKRAVFDTKDYSSRDKLSNDEKLERLFVGLVSLKKFIDYLQENHIDVFSVSSAIFRDSKLIKRFPKFSRYIDLLGDTKKLMEQEEESRTFISNDEVYDDLMRKSKNVINNIPLRSIKDVIDSRMTVSTKRKESVMEEVLDKPLLERSFKKLQSFFTPSNDKSIPGIFSREKSSLDVYLKYFLEKGIVVREGGYWKVNTDMPIRTILEAGYQGDVERADNIMLFINSGPSDVKSQYLTYLRSFEFVGKFLLYINDILKLLYRDSKGNILSFYSNFRVFLTLNDNKDLLSVPSKPINYTQFSNILDRYNFEYYLSDGEVQDINDFLIKWYRLMYREFEELLEYVRGLLDSVYSSYVSGANFSKDSGPPTYLLKKVGTDLYRMGETNMEEYPNFLKFKYLSGVDEETGFIKRGKTLYKETIFGYDRYLHETGYWVKVEDGRTETYSISRNDTFGG